MSPFICHNVKTINLKDNYPFYTQDTSQQLHAAIASLPDKQAKRIYAHYFMSKSKTAIAKEESVSEKAVRKV